MNASYSRELPGKLTLEVGYMGRLSRRLLMEGDVYTPDENYKDPGSGITWQQNAMTVYNLANTLAKSAGVPYNNAASLIANEVAANPSLVPNLPFVNNVWPGYKDAYFPGSASANYFYSVYGVFGSSFLDSLHAADRISGEYIPGKCLSVPGCYTFFAQQGSTQPMWMNAGEADFHGLTVSVRRRFANGLQFDFNYTLSHSIDNGSAAESGAGEQGASIQDIYNLSAFRGSSDFDIRNNFNANFLYALPVGKGKTFLKNAPGWLDEAIGGWQVSTIWRYSTPLPSAVQGDLAYNTNYWLSSLAVVNTPTSFGRSAHRSERPSECVLEYERIEQLSGSAAGGRRNARCGPPGPDIQRGYLSVEVVPPSVGGAQTRVPGRGVQRLQPRELHQSQPEPGIAADVRRVSGYSAAALNAVRFAI